MRLLLALTLLAALSSCDSGGPDFTGLGGLSGDRTLLAGTWTWTRSYTCGDGSGPCSESTPASTGRVETLTFTPERTATGEGTVAGFFNGVVVGPTTYQVDVAASSEGEASYYIDLGGRVGAQFGVSRDRLVLSTAASDGEETTYRRRD